MDFLQELIDYGMCNMIDDRLADFLENDKEYDRLEKELDEFEKKYMHLDIDKEMREFFDGFITANEVLKDYMYERTYFMGIRDSIALLSRLGLIKKEDIS